MLQTTNNLSITNGQHHYISVWLNGDQISGSVTSSSFTLTTTKKISSDFKHCIYNKKQYLSTCKYN